MDYFGLILSIGVAGLALFAVLRYIYLNFKERRYLKPIRNLFILTAVLSLLYYGTNHNWFGNNEPCYSYDMRGCTENG